MPASTRATNTRMFGTLLEKTGLRPARKEDPPAAQQTEDGDTPWGSLQVTTEDGDQQSTSLCARARPSRRERAVRHAMEIGTIAGPALEMVPAVGGILKASVGLAVDILKEINMRWENQAEIEDTLNRVQTLQSIVAGDGFLGESGRSFGSAMQFKRRLDDIVNDLDFVQSRGGIDYSHIAGDIKAVQKKLDDTIAECNLAVTFIVAAKLENTRIGNVARIVVVDPFGNLVPFPNIPNSFKELAECVLKRLCTNPAMRQDLEPYVTSGQFEFHLDHDRSGQGHIDIADLVSLQHNDRLAMLVVEHVAPAVVTDCVTCPHCEVNIPITKKSAEKKIVFCSECGRCIKAVDNVRGPLPSAMKRLSGYLTGVIVKTMFPQSIISRRTPRGPEPIKRSAFSPRDKNSKNMVPNLERYVVEHLHKTHLHINLPTYR